MLSVDDALARILAQVCANSVIELPLVESLGCVLARPVAAPFAVPPWDNSSMDGFAVQAVDTEGATFESVRILRVIGQSLPGRLPETRVEAGTAVRIMTGAPLPAGANAVVPFEETNLGPDLGTVGASGDVAVHRPVRPGQNVRPRGEDLERGQRMLDEGQLLGPAELGLLASVGMATVPVVRRPVVAILSTGDELVAPGTALEPGQIYDANSYALSAAVQGAGADPLMLGQVRDDPGALKRRLQQGLQADLILTTAGVSMGDRDFVRAVLDDLGEPEFWRIRMRPGRPLVFGHLRGPGRRVPLVGLPGNPVSALLTFLLLVRPAILKMRGLPPIGLASVDATLEERIVNEDGRRTFARVTLRRDGERWHARLSGPQGSSVLSSLVAADGLAIVPEDLDALEPGESTTVLLLREMTAPARQAAALVATA